MSFPTKTRRVVGFTLTEILVALAIVAVLSAILLAVFGRVREKGRQTKCAGQIRQLNLALRQYVSDNDGFYPSDAVWPQVTLPYAKSVALYECPTESNAAPARWDAGYQSDYGLNSYFLNTNTRRVGQGQWRGDAEVKTAQADPTRLWTLTDSNPSDNAPETMVQVPVSCGPISVDSLVRHSGGQNFAFADGHVKWLSPTQVADMYCYLLGALS